VGLQKTQGLEKGKKAVNSHTKHRHLGIVRLAGKGGFQRKGKKSDLGLLTMASRLAGKSATEEKRKAMKTEKWLRTTHSECRAG